MARSKLAIVAAASQKFIESGEIGWELVADDIEVYDHDMPDARQYVGHEGFARWLQDWSDAWVEWTMSVQDVREVGDRVLLLGRMKARGASGVRVERDDAILYELRNGQITRLDYFNDQGAALEAASA